MSSDTPIDQCVILVGGLGTRLGKLTESLPKPLLSVGDRPFLSYLIWNAARFGFRKVLLLAGYRADRVIDYRDREEEIRKLGVSIEVALETAPLGTGGALHGAAERLDPRFLLLNGDTWFDFNWLDLATLAAVHPNVDVALALRSVPDAGRYGTVVMTEDEAVAFRDRGCTGEPGLINAGVYVCRREIANALVPGASLECDLFPRLAREGRVIAKTYEGFFIDIGVPESLIMAQTLVPARLRRPAAFLFFTHERLARVKDMHAAVRSLNDAGYYVLLVTNERTITCGLGKATNRGIQQELRRIGAHVDDFRFSDGQETALGMIPDFMRNWRIDLEKSFIVGDQVIHGESAAFAGIKAYPLSRYDLHGLIGRILSGTAIPVAG